MALVLEANYSKKLGLPGYSSHQYSITVRTELSDVNQVEAESKRLYGLLQTCVDREIQSTGFLPDQPFNGHGQDRQHSKPASNGAGEEWKCSPKQRDLILKLVDEKKLKHAEVERLSQQLFGTGVRSLNKLQASGLIGELTAEEPGAVPRHRQQAPSGIPATGGRR